MSLAYPLPARLPLSHSISLIKTSEGIGSLLGRMLVSYSAKQQLAWLSTWSQWFFAGTLLPWCDQLYTKQRAIALWQWHGSFSLTEQGFPDPINLPSLAIATASNGEQQQVFVQLVDQFIAPLCQALSGVAGHPLSLFWSNAAVRLHQGMQKAEQQQANTATLKNLLASPHLGSGEINRLANPLINLAPDDQPARYQRKHCCMRFHLTHQLCVSCPLERCPSART